jgi:DNA-binding LacI/PurR family transcriptional regulator
MPNDQTSPRPITLKDIAQHCGLNVMTVSLALRNVPGRVNADTRARILAAAELLGYDPALTHAARSLRLSHTSQQVANKLVALFIRRAFLQEPFEHMLFSGVMDALVQEGYGIVTFFHEDVETQGLHPVVLRGDVDGLITTKWPAPLQAKLAAQPSAASRPLVSLLSHAPGVAGVLADDAQGAYDATAHLLALGHRHLLHFYTLAPLPHLPDELPQRVDAMARAYRDQGLDPTCYLHRCNTWRPFGKDPNDLEWVWAAVEASLRQHPEITALLAPNDLYAVSLYHAVQVNGLRVPEDLSLVGFDDAYAVRDAHRRNLLTTVRVPLMDIAREAVRFVLELGNNITPSDSHRTYPTKLIVRATTATPPSRG